MVVVSVLLYGLTIAGFVLCYLFFAPWASCGLNIFFITFALALVVLFTGISLHPQVGFLRPKVGSRPFLPLLENMYIFNRFGPLPLSRSPVCCSLLL